MPETPNERAAMRSSSGSRPRMRRMASPSASVTRSMSASCEAALRGSQADVTLRLTRVGDEQLLTVLVFAEIADDLLCGGGDHELGERLATRGVDVHLGELGRVHGHHMVDVG